MVGSWLERKSTSAKMDELLVSRLVFCLIFVFLDKLSHLMSTYLCNGHFSHTQGKFWIPTRRLASIFAFKVNFVTLLELELLDLKASLLRLVSYWP